MFFPELHLNVETAALCGCDDLTRVQRVLGETLAAFDSSDSDVRAEIQVRRKFSLSHSDFKRPSARDGRDPVRASQRDFRPGRVFIRHDPARHRDLERGHQMGALLQVTG